MKALLLALAITLGADNITTCTNKLNRATVDLKTATILYSWKEYQKSLRYMQSSYDNREDAKKLCSDELNASGTLNLVNIQQMELKDTITILKERLAR